MPEPTDSYKDGWFSRLSEQVAERFDDYEVRTVREKMLIQVTVSAGTRTRENITGLFQFMERNGCERIEVASIHNRTLTEFSFYLESDPE